MNVIAREKQRYKSKRQQYNKQTFNKELKVNLVVTKVEQRNKKEQEMRKKQKEKLTFAKFMTKYSRRYLTINKGS